MFKENKDHQTNYGCPKKTTKKKQYLSNIRFITQGAQYDKYKM